jgi:enediyne biosynthesis protein E4
MTLRRVLKVLGLVLGALLVAGAIAAKVLFGGVDSSRHGVTGSLFRDVTKESGIRFHFHGDIMDAKLIPTMGSGVSLGDVDGDGYLDVLLVQQVKSGTKYVKAGKTQPLADCARLYRNRGDGTFEDMTEASGLRACGWGVAGLFADLDNDGDVDIVIGNAGEEDTVWRNDGNGRFTKVENTGLPKTGFTVGVAVFDANGDGVPDLYLGHYLDTDPVRESAASGLGFKTPDEYKGQDNTLLGGKGDLTFIDVTDRTSTRDPGSKTIGAAAFDYDGDGWSDLYVASDQWRNSLFHSETFGRFKDVSDETGTGYPQDGGTAFGRKTRSGMGLAIADFDGDGRPDIYVTNYANEPDTLYRNVEGATFEEADRQAFGGDADPTLPVSKWGVVAFDYDDDGKEDLAVSSGQIMSRFFTVLAGWLNPIGKNFAIGEKSYAQRQFLFRNESAPGRMSFKDVSAASGDLGRLTIVGRGLATGDLDGDGRLDLVYNPIDHAAIVLKNETKGGKALELLPVAGADRKTVLGTKVTVNGRTKEFQVQPSYAGGSWLPLHFGLGTASSAKVNVRWPDGSTWSSGDAVPAGFYRMKKGAPTLYGRARELKTGG